MRISTRFTAAMLVGIFAILTADAALAWRREVAFFERDMQFDHELIGDVVAREVRRTQATDGREAALQVPHAIDQGGRHLQLRWVADGDRDLQLLAPDRAARLQAGDTVAVRDGGSQRTFVPIALQAGERTTLEIREPLTAEQQFSSASLARTGTVAGLVLLVSGLLTFAVGEWFVRRPMQSLCRRAERVGAGDLSLDPAPRGSDEIRTLAAAMDAMCVSLQQARERIEQETERRIAALEQLRHADRLATVGQLAAGVAHELGTPLNVAWEHARSIARDELEPAEVREGAVVIAEQARQMTSIIRQLLDFARPRPPDRTALDLGAAVAGAVQMLEPMAQRRGVALGVDRCDNAVVHADPAQLQQVLTNLVVNALQATPAGGRVQVRVRTEPSAAGASGPDRCCVDVIDSGGGIAAEHLPRLFEPFFTTKGVGDGTGLGLSVSRGIVVEHGGTIEVESAIGKGARFTVRLPAGGAA